MATRGDIAGTPARSLQDEVEGEEGGGSPPAGSALGGALRVAALESSPAYRGFISFPVGKLTVGRNEVIQSVRLLENLQT